MYDGFVNAASEVFGPSKVVVDRYHVSKLYRKPLDNLRIKEMARLKQELEPEEYKKLEGMMWIIRKQHECLTQSDKDKLALLYQHSPALKQAHKYALKLTHIFNCHSNRKTATDKVANWIKVVNKSGLTCFNAFIKTLEKYKPFILNYFKARKNSGFVEGLNNKIKVAKRRCYCLLKVESFFQRLFLDFRGYDLFI
jgi:transposase